MQLRRSRFRGWPLGQPRFYLNRLLPRKLIILIGCLVFFKLYLILLW